jgi:hypothetical protein
MRIFSRTYVWAVVGGAAKASDICTAQTLAACTAAAIS